MKFSQLAKYFEKISENTSRLEITRLLAEIFNKLTADEIEKVVYLLQGRVRPAYEKIEFGMAEKMVIKAIISALNVDKSYFEKEYKKIGDLGETTAYFRSQFSSIEEKDLEINEVYDVFLKIAQASGEKSQEVKVGLLSLLIRQLNSLSSKFIVRFPTGNIRLGFSDMTILDGFSWMIVGNKSFRDKLEKAYHVRPDLGYLGRLIKEEGIKFIENISPRIFTPIIMMRAERLSSGQEIIDQLGECLVEPKFDGFRLQIHYQKKTGIVKLFSRSLEEVSFMYPDIIAGIKNQIIAEEVILEGEAVGYDIKNEKFLPFQETVQRKRKYDIEEMVKKIPLKLFCFELLYLDGVSFLNEPFINRRQQLEKIIKTNKDIKNETIFLAKKKRVSQAKKIDEMFDFYIKKDLEGLIAKKIDGTYKPGAREWNWIKYKKSYSAKIKDTIDCVVMGYDLGKGKRKNFGIGAFLVGVYNNKNDQFLTVAKIGTGLTDEEWYQLKEKCDLIKTKEKPNNYIVDKTMECDVWLEPKLVVEIRADEITKSPVHTAKLALRFPRLERFRDDKNFYEITTLKELNKMSVRF